MRELVDTGLDARRLQAVRKTIRSAAGVRAIRIPCTRLHGGQATADVHVMVDPLVSVSEDHLTSLLVGVRLEHEIDEIADVVVQIDPEDDERVCRPPTVFR